jgi:4-diphosphocytidyl-2-C-methyl-D-erythritol kinase
MHKEQPISSLTLKSYAKINLFLRIHGQRPDGYHEIETVFQTIGLYDTIILTRRTDHKIRIICADPLVPADKRNLCHKAAWLLQQTLPGPQGITIEIKKRIPVGAGLGGGSSNAAITLLGLNTLWQAACSTKKLLALAEKLGADVPFFLRGGTAYATGKGEKITFLRPAGRKWVVLVYPNIAISTAWAYKNLKLDLTRQKKNTKIKCLQNKGFLYFSGVHGNDFEPLIFENFPAIRFLQKRLGALGAQVARLSGSGSSVFGVFNRRLAAERVFSILHREYPQVYLAQFEAAYPRHKSAFN